ncbi:WD repeat protein [Aspergillus clavatus NRRL 1]|uniref:WD repeat protein n=1 Tax=Aspergillus clavatus (strain ATCC 1007 / CBS 513.65 / DSM 816 / NCTC 3887 / NRRL 1 / QM 1276 / 107) TaxID=344612 RepID=A1CF29_ASPCL|nr:WD repeat protein [Aspergillus clavatus NRRL 1]EAW11478.1 WD repeat protein [Aspergillus clavatus NRRL 1]
MSEFPRLPTRGHTSSLSFSSHQSTAPPPPPPPAPVQQGQKYSHRAASALARFAQPFFSGSRPPSPQAPAGRADLSTGPRSIRSKSLPGESQTVTHKTGIPIAALDISPQRTHAVIGGKEILKTIRVSPDGLSEEANLRNAIISYSSTHHGGSALSARHKDQLTVRDVKWSHGKYDRIIATAVANGRIVVYDLNRTGLEYCRFQGHSRQVHRLAFNPHSPAWLLSGSQDSTIRLWDLRAASTERGVPMCGSKEQYLGNSDAIRDIQWSPNDNSMFATATDSGAIQLWDYRKASAPIMRITAHDRPCFSVDWHPDGKHVVSGGMDRQVKVWDFSSSAERRQKPTFHFRTPQAVLNVRWRPPSSDREPPFSGHWQSCQVVTSYDKEDPRIHLWDLRRPHVPFREFDRHDSNATDLLWHSKDLLWTVGDSGAFTQTDIRYAPHVVNQRPTCAVAWSPNGEVLAFSQKRMRRSIMGLNANEFVGQPEEEPSSGEAVSQSPTDEVLDEPSFVSIRHHRFSKSSSSRPSKSLSSTPPGAPEFGPVLQLDETLSKSSPPGPRQLGVVGSVPGATSDPALFRHLARHYAPLLETPRTDLLRVLLEALAQNAESADEVSLLKLAQTWRIVKLAVIQELEVRAREQRQNSEKGSRNVKKRQSKEGRAAERPPGLDDGRADRLKNRLFRGVIETDAPKNTLVEPESTSNIATPLARPLPDSPGDSLGSSHSQMTSLNDDDIEPLPPSVLSSNQGTLNSNVWSSMSDVEPNPITQFEHRQSDASEIVPASFDSLPRRESVPQNSESDQRSAPRSINRRADWRVRNHPDYIKGASEDDEFDQKMETKRAAIRDYKLFPKKVLSLDSHITSPKPAFQRHESSESFPMFSESTGSSHPSKLLATSFSSVARLHDRSKTDEYSAPVNESHQGDAEIAAESAPHQVEIDADDLFQEGISDVSHTHLERPSSPPLLVKESTPLEALIQDSARTTGSEPITRTIPGCTEDFSEISVPLSPHLSGHKPWSAEVLLKEAIRYYYSSSHVDIQSAAHLLQKLRTLFQECEKILPREECELIFKTYHEHLIRQSMYIEAAELRLLCVPLYPAVYEYTQTDTFINVFCFTCKRPYENPKQDNRQCYQCNNPQEPCAICMSLDPPFEWTSGPSASFGDTNLEDSEATSHLLSSSHSSLKTEQIPSSELQYLDEVALDQYTSPQPKGSTLWTWCQGCGHGGHVACITTWLSDVSISEGGCATPGCMHDCGPGPRREHNRSVLQEESKKRDSTSRKPGAGFVKRDPWTKGESKAVEKVRGMLGVAASGGSNAPTATMGAGGAPSSGMMSPKKVRLVTPSEQGKQRSGSTRASRGSGLSG